MTRIHSSWSSAVVYVKKSCSVVDVDSFSARKLCEAKVRFKVSHELCT